MNIEPGERAVICSVCNAYLYAESIFDGPKGLDESSSRLVKCPYQCEVDRDGIETNNIPKNEGRYGRS